MRSAPFGSFADKKSPFFLYVAYYAPHFPIHARPAAVARCRGRYLQGWDVLRRERFQRLKQLSLARHEWQLADSDPPVAPWSQQENKAWQDLRMAVYAAMIEDMDHGIGRILQALDESGAAGNTLVLFLSDNGGKAGADLPMDRPDVQPGSVNTFCSTGPGWGPVMNAPFRGWKQTAFEGGIATPLIASWPGVIRAGDINHQVGHVVDILPTFAELAGGATEAPGRESGAQHVDGKSLVPLLRGRTRTGHQRLYWSFRKERLEGTTVVAAGKGAAVREGNWKLRWDESSQAWELYDLTADRTETTDLSKKFPQHVARMKDAYEAWRQRVGAF